MAEYIDRGDLIEKINTVLSQMKYAENTSSYFAFEMFTVILKRVPTADVVEVKHGEWITPTKIKSMIIAVPHCSVCGLVPYDKGLYCPYCGAKMDLKEGAEG